MFDKISWNHVKSTIFDVIIAFSFLILVIFYVLMMYKIVTGTNLLDVLFRGSELRIPITHGDILTQTQNMIALVSVVLAVVTAMSGLIIWYARKKIEKLEQMEDRFSTLNRTLLIAMETALLGLPKLDESQHIPHECAEIAHEIDKIFRDHPELEKEIDKIDNGAKLRLVRSHHYFAVGDYDNCIRYLEEIVDNKLGDMDARRMACYWLGIAYRQRGNYGLSARYFSNMENY
jgi:hypothetical protein